MNRDNNTNPQSEIPQWPQYNLEKLKDDSVVFLYKLRLSELTREPRIGTAEERYDFLKQNIHTAATETLGQKIRYDVN